MSLKEKLKDAAIDHLRHVYDDPKLTIKIKVIADSIPLKALYDSGIINDQIIEESLEYAVLKRAKADLEFLLKKDKERPKYADHDVTRNDMFAYALEKGIFTEKGIKMIPFDQNTIESYCKLYGKENLLTYLKDEQLNIPKRMPLDNSFENNFRIGL